MAEPGALPRAAALRHDVIKGFRDQRGVLYPVDVVAVAGFAPVRLFWITDVPAGEIRGRHGHRDCVQYLICCKGQVEVTVFDGTEERAITLDPGQALRLSPGLFGTQRFAGPDTMLLVLCDRLYDAADYLHTREEFMAFLAARSATPGSAAS